MTVGPCPCECNSGGFCGGCGHAGCGGRRQHPAPQSRQNTAVKVGATVRDKKWGGRHTGTVTKVDDQAGTILVSWHDTVVEDELKAGDVEVI